MNKYKPVKIKWQNKIMHVRIDGHFDTHNVWARAESANYDGGIFFTEISTGKTYAALSRDVVVLPSTTKQIFLVLIYILKLVLRLPILLPLFLWHLFCTFITIIPILGICLYDFAFNDSSLDKNCLFDVIETYKDMWGLLIHGR